MPTKTAPLCPKCQNPMHSRGVTPSGKTRWRCDNGGVHCYTTTNPNKLATSRSGNSQQKLVFNRTLSKQTKRYIVTAAQNGTPVHEAFFQSLLVAAKSLGAELLVIPIRYKNPTSRWTLSQANAEHWDVSLQPYLYNGRRKLNANLVLLGDIKTVPTASSPLTGFDAISGGESAILGHTKLQLKVVPTPSNKLPKILTTTGAVTVLNYTDSKAGKIGEFHHMLGAVIVELEDKIFHMRHVSADAKTGEFTDLATRYTPTGAHAAPRPCALVMGDTHVDYIDPKVEEATFGKGGIVESLNPQTLVWHDLLDGYSCNPHHGQNPFNRIAKRKADRDDVGAEVRRAVSFVTSHTTGDRQSIVVASNHNDFLRRWIVGTDWRSDPVNAEFYLKTALQMVQRTQLDDSGTRTPDPFAYWISRAGHPGVRVLAVDEPYQLAGVDLGQHGELGPNGARGSITNLRRIGARSIIGHSHVPGIDEGAMQVGTSTRLRLEYNAGPSSWLNAHALVHADGKRQLIFIIDGHWRM